MPVALALFAQLFAAAQSKSASPLPQVPFAGCKSDGQMGPLDAPKGEAVAAPMAAHAAQQLAYYKAEYGIGVFAPRGWHCFGTYGSNGASLYVSAASINPKDFFTAGWKGFTGPVIQISSLLGDTSGRFGVARVIARVFPAHRDFVEQVISEHIAPASDFPFGPYPKDKLIYKSRDLVEYETQAGTIGLGTTSWLEINDEPIRGVAMLDGEAPDLLFLAVRLPPALSSLTPVIIRRAERDGASEP